MMSMLCNVWQDFSNWIRLGWSDVTFGLVISIFALCGVLSLLTFFKKSFDKGKKPKWGMLVLAIIMFALLAGVACIRSI